MRLRVASPPSPPIGLGIAAYLTIVHYAGGSPVCAIAHGCETVQKSRYAEFAGVPVALLGLLGYVGDPALAAARRRDRPHRDRVLALAGFGVLGLADLRRDRAARRDLHLVRRLGDLHDAAGGPVRRAPARRSR